MDEQLVRKHAEAHADAVVRGDVPALLDDFQPEVHPKLGDLAQAMPQPVRSASVVSVDLTGDRAVVEIRYTGDDRQVTIRSEWVGDVRPLIADAAPA